MHKILILLATFSLSVGMASAQSVVKKAKLKTEAAKPKHAPKTPEQQADHFAQRLTQKLALSTDQSQRVRQLSLVYHQEEQALKAKYGPERKNPAKHQELKAARARFETQLTQVLSADQATKYAQLREEKMQKHGKSKEKLKAKS
ncbi:hypothetical protein [Hymenobacter cellulosivorans]|uniref:DUF4890 domain-containing protein n=1 Tax=Hymenobacter cellulosivorans TaxID=2932249 RepID=A0ABY4F3Z9_9BACT|nr:hypothetical protein [Hymenobacter cellulosivorans]UOQ50956.1 hypothetical protein MUN80_14435 [Hymenobacter cellulosivorans]